MPTPNSSVSLRDVAAVAGVSATAVSFAINGRAGVSEARRAHILAVAKKLGYRPDAEMVKLMARVATTRRAQRQATLGVLTGFPTARPWETNSSVLAFWDGAKARAEELGYGLEEFWYYEPGMTPKRLRGILRARGIEGLLLTFAPTNEQDMRLDFDFSGFACGMSGICITKPELSFVLPDHFQNTMLALERARALGYRRPLLALPGGIAHRTQHLIEGAYLYFCEAHAEMRGLPIQRQDDYEAWRLDKVIEETRPDVVLCSQPDWGLIYRESVPNVFGWIALGRMRGDERFLAGVDRRLEAQGGAVVDVVVAQIHRGEFGAPELRKEVLVPGRWVDGASLPRRKAARAER